jgi:tetraacyldisaccharide 4'-kinase
VGEGQGRGVLKTFMKKNSLESFFLNNWYGKSRWALLLFPLAIIFVLLSTLRKFWLIKFKQRTPTIPTIIVGNISVGGTGKTPLLIALVKKLQAEDLNPGVISRGYGSQAKSYPYLLTENSTAVEAGDEPISIFNQTQCPLVVGPDRMAATSLVRDQNVMHVLSDDGLQDYGFGRHLEIAVIDGQRWFGNGWRLPVGPLREAVSRLNTVDMVVVNNPSANPPLDNFHKMDIKPVHWVNLKTSEPLQLTALKKTRFHAVAGIGNPQRFYQTLRELNLDFAGHDFSDHYAYSENDFSFAGDQTVLMTEKDAVKCKGFAKDNWYYLVVEAQLDERFWNEFMERVNAIRVQKVDLSK